MRTPVKNETVMKVLALSGELKENSFHGIAAGLGNIDRGCDVIAPGCFQGLEGDFVRDGSAMRAHAWSDVAIGYIDSCSERKGTGKEPPYVLAVSATFHSTDKAQEIRTVMAERLEAGKTVGLSIGFRIADDKWFESGDDLLAFAKGKGITGLDKKEISECKSYCRLIIKAEEIFEVSYAPIPMNTAAMATAVKNIFGGDGSHAPLTLQDHADTVLAAVTGLISRLTRYSTRKSGDDKSVSADRLAEAEDLHKSLGALITTMRDEDEDKSEDLEETPQRNPVADALLLRTLAQRTEAITNQVTT